MNDNVVEKILAGGKFSLIDDENYVGKRCPNFTLARNW